MQEKELPPTERLFQDLSQYASPAPVAVQMMYAHALNYKTEPAIVQ